MAETYDFVDFGCSKGGSMRFAMDALGGQRGIGLDIDPDKVDACRRSGFEAEVADLTELGEAWEQSARFVTLSHFLEHLPTRELAFRCLDSAIKVARSFVFVRQPYFDADRYLHSEGLKLFWSDWHGHPNKMMEAYLRWFFDRQLNMGRITRFVTFARGRIWHSDSDVVHPMSSLPDQHEWNPELHQPRPHLDLDHPVFRELGAVAAIRTRSFGANVDRFLSGCTILHDQRSVEAVAR